MRDAAVVGISDETFGQRLAAAGMLRAHCGATPEALIEFLPGELATYELPRLVRIVDDVPRNTLGKVRKPELAQMLAADAQG